MTPETQERETRLFGHLTKQGTAMAETVLCEHHAHDGRSISDSLDYAGFDSAWNGEVELDEVTGNDVVECIICGTR